MRKFKVFLISMMVCFCGTMLLLSASVTPKKEQHILSAADNVSAPEAEKRPPLSQEEIERIAREKQEYLERDKKNPNLDISQEQDIVGETILEELCEKNKHYEILQAENDQKAINTVSRYNSKSNIQKIETVQDEITIMHKMLDVIKSGNLEYTEIRPMILYMAARGDMIEDAFAQEIQKVVSPFLQTDPQLISDIEVAYDPMYFGS